MTARRLSLIVGVTASALAAPAVALAQTSTKSAAAPTPAPPAPSASPTPTAPAPNPVIEWNRTLLAIVRTKTPQPLQPPTIHPTRAFAMLPLGIYDAVAAVLGGRPYLGEHVLRRPG